MSVIVLGQQPGYKPIRPL